MSYVVAFWPEGLCDNGPDADWAACYERLKGTQRGPDGPVVGAFPAEVTAELSERDDESCVWTAMPLLAEASGELLHVALGNSLMQESVPV